MAVTQEPIADKPVVNTRALDDALNTQMAGLPPEVRAASKTRQLAAKAQSDVDQALASKQREVYEPIESRYREQVQQTQQQVGDIGQQLAKPFEVPKETVSDFAALGGLVAIAGTLLGSSGKQSANNVLASMTGIVSGYKKGRQDLIQQAFKEFEVNMKRLQALSTNAQTQLELASKLSATDKEKAKLLFAEIQAKYNGSIVAAKVAGEDAFNALSAANQVKQTNIAASSAAQRIEEWKAGEETRRLQKQQIQQQIDIGKGEVFVQDGKLVYLDKTTKTLIPIEGSEGARRVGSKDSVLDREVLNEVNKYYPTLKPENLSGLSKDGVKRVIGSLETIKSIEHIAEYIKQNPQSVGASAKLKNIINLDAIKSITGDDSAAANAKSAIIDRQIDAAQKEGKLTADEVRSAKVLNKMLFAVALSDVQSSGQRGSVYLDRAFQGLYDQSSRLDTLMNILDERIRESDRRLNVLDMNVANRADTTNFPLTMSNSDQWMSQNFPILTPDQLRELKAKNQLTPGMWFRGTDNIPRQVNIGAK